MTIRILESGAALARHSDGWQRLADRVGQPFLSSDYLLSAIEAFHLRDTLRIVVLESGGDLVAAAPLVLVRRNLHWALELIGTPRLMDPTGFLHDSPASLRELVAAVSALGYPIHLRGVAADGETLEAVRRGLRQEGGVVVTHDPRVSAAVLIRGDWASYQASLTPKMRQDLRRFQSRAQAIGRPEFAWSAPSSGDAEGLVGAFLALEASGWKAREPGALVRAAPLRAFYAALITRAAARGTLRVATLHLDEAPAAMLWALEAYDRLWLLKMAYQDRVARISPGVLLMRFVLRTAHDLRLDAVEFLADDALWQQRWQPVARCYTSALAVPLTARGLIGLGLNAVFSAPAAPAGSVTPLARTIAFGTRLGMSSAFRRL